MKRVCVGVPILVVGWLLCLSVAAGQSITEPFPGVRVTNAAALAPLRQQLAAKSRVSRIVALGASSSTFAGPVPAPGIPWSLSKDKGLYAEFARLLKARYGDAGTVRPWSESRAYSGAVFVAGGSSVLLGGSTGWSALPGQVAPYTGAPVVWFRSGLSVGLNSTVCPSAASTPAVRGLYYKATASIRGFPVVTGREPTWPAAVGASVIDSAGITWKCQGLLVGSGGAYVGGGDYGLQEIPIPLGWCGEPKETGFSLVGWNWGWRTDAIPPTEPMVQVVPACRTIRVVYGKYSNAAGAFRVMSDGVLVGTESWRGASTGLTSNVSAEYDLGADTDHTLSFVGVSGRGCIESVICYREGKPNGILDANLAVPGMSMNAIVNAKARTDAARRDLVGTSVFGAAPDAVIYSSFVNDAQFNANGVPTNRSQAQYAADCATFAGALRPLGMPLIWLIPPANGQDSFSGASHAYALAGAQAALRANPNTVIVDSWLLWGGSAASATSAGYYLPIGPGMQADTVHFGRKGVQLYARALESVLFP